MKNNLIIKLLWILLLCGLWQIIYQLAIFPEILFPSPRLVLSKLIYGLMYDSMLKEILYSLWIIGIGLFIGIILATILSILSLISKAFESFIETCISIAHPLPGIALLPLIIIWFGTNEKAIIFIIVHSVLWPLILNIISGFHTVPEIYKQIGNNIGLSKYGIALHIYLPASLPYFIAGLRISWARSWRALVSAEMIFGAAGGIGGIGWLIFKNRVFMDTAGLFASILVIIIIGIIIENVVFTLIEKLTVKKWGMIQ